MPEDEDEPQPVDRKKSDNPFWVPGMGVNPYQPLTPWDEAEQGKYYVAVDHTEEAYRQFLREVDNDSLRLRKYGRLVVVFGSRGCGKTSLINRCVAWIAEHVRTADKARLTRTIIINQTRSGDHDDESFRDRSARICQAVIDRVTFDLSLDSKVVEELRDRTTPPASRYEMLSNTLNRISTEQSAILVILLPPTDLAEEIAMYANMVQPRLIFCVEGPPLDASTRWQNLAGRPDPPIALRVNPLRPTDPALFARERFARHHSGAPVPTVGEDVMTALETSPAVRTIDALVRLMHGLYERRLTKPGAGLEPLSLVDVADYYLSQQDRWRSS